MLNALIAIYRANPFRPHCNSAAGVHAWTCRIAGAVLKGEPIVPDCKHRKLSGPSLEFDCPRPKPGYPQ